MNALDPVERAGWAGFIIGLVLTTAVYVLLVIPSLTRPVEHHTHYVSNVPECMEDEPYLHGFGDFRNGRWSSYACLHIDDVLVAD